MTLTLTLTLTKVEPPIDQSPKAMGKLRKEAERVKDILSANTMYKVTLGVTARVRGSG